MWWHGASHEDRLSLALPLHRRQPTMSSESHTTYHHRPIEMVVRSIIELRVLHPAHLQNHNTEIQIRFIHRRQIGLERCSVQAKFLNLPLRIHLVAVESGILKAFSYTDSQ